ncbi:velvet factor-domain-containing protein [Powellomyces hirtus]|nr:velvet factor-domain-containing protein [Powellomyces hirtus]
MQPSPAVSTADFGSADAQPVHHQSEGTGTAQTNQLIIRQQPNRARMCGFGTKDYRPVDPAPILQLIRTEASQVVLDYKQATSLVCHASLWSADGTEERGVVLNPGSAAVARRSESLFQNESHVLSDPVPPTGYVSVLVGSLVSPCHVLTDVDGSKSLFFTFPDLSIRTSGQYLLKFSLYDISQDASHAMAFAISDVISVYPPKTFPGMTESSQLAKCLARQGIKLHIRSDMRRNHNLGAAGGEPPAGFSGQEAPPGEEFGGEPEVVL